MGQNMRPEERVDKDAKQSRVVMNFWSELPTHHKRLHNLFPLSVEKKPDI